MKRILTAELRRVAFHRGMHLVTLVALLLYLIDTTVKVVYTLAQNHGRSMDSYHESLAFPGLVFTSLGTSYILMLVLGPAIVALVFGQDYSSDTWKMILPKVSSRYRLYLAKSLTAFAGVAFIILLGQITLGVGSAIASAKIGARFFFVPEPELLHFGMEIGIETIVFTLWYTTLSAVLVIASRSQLVGAFATLSAYFGFVFIRMYSPEYIALWFAPSHFSNLLPEFYRDGLIHGGHRLSVASSISWLITGAHLFAQILLGSAVLKKQDFD